jgi:hypothetical protein
MGLLHAFAILVSFALQTLCVFGGNSRWFGLFKEGSGWKTNVEMSALYTSLVTPAGWAFAIWGIIYITETVAALVLAYALWGTEDAEVLPPVSMGLGRPDRILTLWLLMNGFQASWSQLFAKERLVLSSLALSGIAASLLGLGFEMSGVHGPLGYFTVCFSIWLHAGWTTAAALVNWNLVLVGRAASAPAQLAAAFATSHAALAAALAVLASAGCVALPYGAALAWALAAIRHKILNPDAKETANNPAIAEVGEPARAALEMSTGLSSSALIATMFVVLTCTAAFEWGAVR